MLSITIRSIQASDNPFIAKIIRSSLEEFGANKPGTVYFDDSIDNLFQLFQFANGSQYFIALHGEEVIGGGGIFPTESLPVRTCELVKMYLKKEYRGIGFGKRMMNECLTCAKQKGYTQVYIETMPELKKAVAVYEKMGFEYLSSPLGNSGHTGCDIWMLKQL